MKVRTLVAIAGISLTMASFTPQVFAQAGGVGGTSGAAGMPAAGSGSGGIFQQAPSAGQPGTQAPASAAPLGASTSDWMSHEDHSAVKHSSLMPSSEQISQEKQLRLQEKNLEHDIAAYRADGYKIQPAAWEKWLGSESLARGDQPDASKHFQTAAMDLRRIAEAGQHAMPLNNSDAGLHGNETGQMTNGTDLHSNRSSRAVY